MGSIFKRSGRSGWYASYKDATGAFKQAALGTSDEKVAKRMLSQIEARFESGDAGGATTLRAYSVGWVQRRREKFETDGKQHRDWKNDQGRLNKHVLPSFLGAMQIDEIRPRHLATYFHELRRDSGLAPHTVRNVYGLLQGMFRDAQIAGLVDATPCILTANELGADAYVDQAAHDDDRYTAEQLATLVYSTALPEHARVFVALGGLAGLRLGEIAGLRIGSIDRAAAPLWRMTVSLTYDSKPTKTAKPRAVPVHPALAEILGAWLDTGWAALFGRTPTAGDPLVPRAPGHRVAAGAFHTKKTGGDLMDACLAAHSVTAPAKKTHALRSTFISLALEGGGDDYLLERVTHTTKGRRAFDVYAKPNWTKLCAEVAKIELAKPVVSSGDPNGGGGGFVPVTKDQPQPVETKPKSSGGAGSRRRSEPLDTTRESHDRAGLDAARIESGDFARGVVARKFVPVPCRLPHAVLRHRRIVRETFVLRSTVGRIV